MGTEFQLVDSIHRIDRKEWQSLWQSRYPFVHYDFLQSLEDSGCTNAESGWSVSHLVGYEQSQLAFALPLFRKNHSWGEYVFDWSWADAYRRHNLAYYPKLVCAAPFTPATGPRLAVAPHLEHSVAVCEARDFLQGYCEANHISGLHVLFPEKALSEQLRVDGWQQRQGCQFHWFNKNYADFEAFLADFSSRKRKNLRKERMQVDQAGVTLQRLTGAAISKQDWDAFYQFYHMTYLKRSGATGYLNREFFTRLGESLSDQLMMVMAYRGEQRVAASLCFFDDDVLYGRYWGCCEEIAGLHFEACYYQGIEFAIERGIRRFDPGAQGEHKIQRGFEPVLTYSNHWLLEPAFNNAIADFLEQERPAIEQYRQQCAQSLPFKQS